jgi:hypothetical protein
MVYKKNIKLNLILWGIFLCFFLAYGLIATVCKDSFEAISIVELAHVNAPHQRSTINIVDLQNPRISVAGIKYPGDYSASVKENCGLLEGQNIDKIQNKLNVSLLVGSDSTVVMKYRAKTAELAISCINSITDKLLDDQNKVSQIYLNESRNVIDELILKRKEELRNLSIAKSEDLKKVYINSIALLDDEIQRQTLLIKSMNYRQAKKINKITVRKTLPVLDAALYSIGFLFIFYLFIKKIKD